MREGGNQGWKQEVGRGRDLAVNREEWMKGEVEEKEAVL